MHAVSENDYNYRFVLKENEKLLDIWETVIESSGKDISDYTFELSFV